jgi:hypothetical protein
MCLPKRKCRDRILKAVFRSCISNEDTRWCQGTCCHLMSQQATNGENSSLWEFITTSHCSQLFRLTVVLRKRDPSVRPSFSGFTYVPSSQLHSDWKCVPLAVSNIPHHNFDIFLLLAGWPGFDSRHGETFLFFTGSRPVLGPTQPPIQWVPGVTRPRRVADHSI